MEEETELVLSIPAGIEAGQTGVYRGLGHVDIAGASELSFGHDITFL